MARVSVGEVEPSNKVINATHTIWNFQKHAWNAGNFILVAWWEPCFGLCLI